MEHEPEQGYTTASEQVKSRGCGFNLCLFSFFCTNFATFENKLVSDDAVANKLLHLPLSTCHSHWLNTQAPNKNSQYECANMWTKISYLKLCLLPPAPSSKVVQSVMVTSESSLLLSYSLTLLLRSIKLNSNWMWRWKHCSTLRNWALTCCDGCDIICCAQYIYTQRPSCVQFARCLLDVCSCSCC